MFHAPQTALFVIVVGILVAVTTLAPVQHQHQHQHRRNNNNNNNNHHQQHRYDLVLPVNDHSFRMHAGGDAAATEDGTARSERSTNLSHITGTARKIQMYVKNKHLQILPDGTINGTGDDGSDYTIFQRTSVNNGQLKIQGVASCFFLCMDSCGLLYGSREFTEDCVFNEMIEQHHYNTYSSARYSNKKRTLYLALNNRGQPRKVQLRGVKTLGKLSTYARVLTQPVAAERVDDMVARILRARETRPAAASAASGNPIRHHGYHLLCPQVVGHELAEDTDGGRDKFRCRTRIKRKKKKRRCNEGEEEGECERDTEVKENVHNECDDDEESCPKRTDNNKEKKNKFPKKCENGEIGCKRKEEKEKEKEKQDSDKQRTRNNRCEEGECQRKGGDVMSRRRCEKDEAEEECKKRLQESRRRRRERIRDRTLQEAKGTPDEKTKQRKKFTSGKNKKKFVGDGEISKDLDSGRRLAAMMEVATNLNTPADPVTLASVGEGEAPGSNPGILRNLDRRATSVALPEDIPSNNQRSYPEEASTPFSDITTPSRSYSLTRPEVTSNATPDVTSIAPTSLGNYDGIK